MINAKSFVLTPDQSRAARRELALSQRDAIAQTGIQAYKLKQFEAGSFRPDMATLKKLRDFYEGQGVNFDDLSAYMNASGADAPESPDENFEAPKLKPGYTMNPRPGFFISSDLPPAVVDKLMSDMEASDDRIADIVNGAAKTGFLGGLSDETEGQIQELFGHLAMNHIRFRCLQGRNIIEPTRNEAKTVGDHLAKWVGEKGAFVPSKVGKTNAGATASDVPDDQPETTEQE